MSLSEYADDVQSRLADEADVTHDELVEDLDELINEYSVPADEAKDSIYNRYQPDDAKGNYDGEQSSPLTDIGSINEDGEWVTVEAEVYQQWDPYDDSPVTQIGLLRDATGTIKFVSFDDGLPVLEEGESYRIESAVASEDDRDGEDGIDLVLNEKAVSIEKISEVEKTRSFVAPIVAVNEEATGLLKRCSHDDCNRRLKDGECYDHGDVDGENDIGIKATVDDGVNAPMTMFFDADLTEELSGMTLSEAEEIFQETFEKEVITEAIAEEIVGHYFELEASGYGGGRWMVENAERYSGPGITEQETHDLAAKFTEVVSA